MATTNPHLLDFDLETPRHLGNGAPFNQVTRLLQECVLDCEKRPADDRDRVVVVKLKISPKYHQEPGHEEDTTINVIDGCSLRIECENKIPNRKSMEFDCGIGPGGKIVFNPYNPINHRQLPLPNIIDQQQADGKAAGSGS